MVEFIILAKLLFCLLISQTKINYDLKNYKQELMKKNQNLK